MKNSTISLQGLLPQAKQLIGRLKPYMGVLLFLLFAAVYGYLIFRINVLSNATATGDVVTSESTTSPTPHIDAAAIKQLETLKDNSVNVQTLFEQGRTNPFQE